MNFKDMEPGVYTLKVTASSSVTGETTKVERFFELSDHPDFCGLHLINNGLIVRGSSIHVQFAGVPSTIQTFRCKLDNKPGFDCKLKLHYNIPTSCCNRIVRCMFVAMVWCMQLSFIKTTYKQLVAIKTLAKDGAC